jgi:hypothetical protein
VPEQTPEQVSETNGDSTYPSRVPDVEAESDTPELDGGDIFRFAGEDVIGEPAVESGNLPPFEDHTTSYRSNSLPINGTFSRPSKKISERDKRYWAVEVAIKLFIILGIILFVLGVIAGVASFVSAFFVENKLLAIGNGFGCIFYGVIMIALCYFYGQCMSVILDIEWNTRR